jgi:hypothetical protein
MLVQQHAFIATHIQQHAKALERARAAFRREADAVRCVVMKAGQSCGL